MALRYPTQTLRVAAHTPILSILHFVSINGSQRGPTYQTAVRNFACLRPPMAYTVIKDRKQVEYIFTATIVQRLGGRKRGEADSGLHYPYVYDTSRMYRNRAEPRVHIALHPGRNYMLVETGASGIGSSPAIPTPENDSASAAREPTRRRCQSVQMFPVNRESGWKYSSIYTAGKKSEDSW